MTRDATEWFMQASQHSIHESETILDILDPATLTAGLNHTSDPTRDHMKQKNLPSCQHTD